MTEPKRWIEEGAPDSIEHMLNAASRERPPPGSLTRTLASVAAGAALGGAGASASAHGLGIAPALKASGSAGVGLGKIALIVTGMGLAGAGAGLLMDPGTGTRVLDPGGAASRGASPAPPERVPRAAATHTEELEAPTPMPASEPAAREPALSRAADGDAPTARSKPSTGATSAADAARAAPAPASVNGEDRERLADEVRQIDAARAALASGGALRALGLLDAYDARFAEPRFAPEALYLRMQALLAAGRPAEARAAAERLATRFPKSPHAARARAVLDSANP